MTRLRPGILKMLQFLWDVDTMSAQYSDVRHASGVTHKGFSVVLQLAMDDNLVVRDGIEYSKLALTFEGMMALREHFAALYNKRPCEAYRLEMEKYSRVPDRKVAAA